jgi:homoserine trans-succinylase
LRYGNPEVYYDDYECKINKLQEVVVVHMQKAKKDKNKRLFWKSNAKLIFENQLNVSFDIDIPYDILSNGKAHSVALKDIKTSSNL